MSKKPKKVPVIPKDLQDKWGAITSIATAVNCMDKGYYPHNYASAVRGSIQYLGKLHETMVEDALKHPQAHMITELKAIVDQIKQMKKEAKKHGTKENAGAAAIDSSERLADDPRINDHGTDYESVPALG